MNRPHKCYYKQNVLLVTCLLACLWHNPLQAFEQSQSTHIFSQLPEIEVQGARAPTLLKEWVEEEVRAVLKEELPELDIHTIKLISAGWDNLVADVNEEWIFRFPRREELLAVFEREQWLLTFMRYTVNMPVPHYQYRGKRTAFVGYQKILGEPLNAEKYLALPNVNRQAIADDLALFLGQMHSRIVMQEARDHGYQDYKAPFGWIEDSLFGTLASSKIEDMMREALNGAKHVFSNTDHHVFLHNDLHGGNMAFDESLKQITGIFDFSDAKVGHYAIDFGQLFMIHPELAMRTAKAYALLRGVQNPIIPAAAMYIVRRGVAILCAREQGNAAREKNLYQQLEEFLPIWQELKL